MFESKTPLIHPLRKVFFLPTNALFFLFQSSFYRHWGLWIVKTLTGASFLEGDAAVWVLLMSFCTAAWTTNKTVFHCVVVVGGGRLFCMDWYDKGKVKGNIFYCGLSADWPFKYNQADFFRFVHCVFAFCCNSGSIIIRKKLSALRREGE